MQPGVFNELLKQLKDVNFKIAQTSGNGEAFLNPHYLDYIQALKETFPDKPRWTYNNFSQLNKERADRIIAENLFDKVNVRIDSLIPWIFEKNSNLSKNIVFENLEYFLSKNKLIPVVILYNHIPSYYKRCWDVIGKRPTRDYFTDEELAQIPDEQSALNDYFQKYSNVSVCRMNHSLWGEREQAQQDKTWPCPKVNVINAATWVVPDGQIMACCYCDKQDEMSCGNIMQEHILDIFYGKRRAEWIRKIKSREITDYPCRNPRCCGFGDGIEEK